MEKTTIFADVNYETAVFFKKYGADMGIDTGEVLNRLLTDISGKTIEEAVGLVMWYYDAMTSNNDANTRTEILYIFTALCMTLVEYKTTAPFTAAKKPQSSDPGKRLKLNISKHTLSRLNAAAEKRGLAQSAVIEKTVYDFINTDDKIKPYMLINYMFLAADALIPPQARLAVMLIIKSCIDRICNMTGSHQDEISQKLENMKSFALQNENVKENIDLLKNTGFYRDKLC